MALLIVVLGGCRGAVPPKDQSEVPAAPAGGLVNFTLRDLSRFAREVDSGARTLSQARNQDGMPDRLLTELRAYVHEHPEVGPRILEYLRSNQQPLTARALVVIALAQPDRPEIVALIASFLADPPDMKLVTAWGIGFEDFRSRDWDLSYTAMLAVTDSRAWQVSLQGIGIIQEPGRGPLDGLDFTPILDALLMYVNRDDAGRGRALALMHAQRLSRRPEATEAHRRRVQELARQSYLRADEAWGVAMDYVPAEVLARRLERFSIDRRVSVLNEIANRAPEVLNRESCTAHIEEAIRYLSRTQQEGGPYEGSFESYCWGIMNAPGADSRAEFMLVKSPSVVLRRRALRAIDVRFETIPDSPDWPRWKSLLVRLLQDSDSQIRRIAGRILAEAAKRNR